MSGLALAWRLARRELRGGLSGFRVFLACLAIGVAAIAAVGSITAAITSGLQDNGRAILGGDAEVRLTHRFATDDERALLAREAGALSEVVDFRGMVGAPSGESALAQVKAVDDAYPLVGAVTLADGGDLHDTLAARDGTWGAVAEAALVDRLALEPGDRLRLGTTEVELRGTITFEPDRQAAGFGLGPRLMVRHEALEGSGLLQPGSLYRVAYRLTAPEGLDALRAAVDEGAPDAGWRWRDVRDPSPGTARTVERIGTFLVLVGLASLAVGGVGVSAATRGYLERKTATIGTLKAMGASGGLTVRVYLLQIAALAVVGIAVGLVIGAGVPLILAPFLKDALPVPTAFGVYPSALAEAALYGALTAILFALWPLARARETPAAVLFRDVAQKARALPRPAYLAAILAVFAALVGAAVWFTGSIWLGGAFIAGLVAALAALWAVAHLIRWGARALGRRGSRSPSWRLALADLGGPSGETTGTMLSLGLGLTLLSAIGQIDSNLRGLIAEDLSGKAPAFFFLDIPAPQREAFVEKAATDDRIERIETAPMLRGRITRLNGVPAAEAKIDPAAAWMLQGDRGLTYATDPPEGTTITAGAWWAADYAGEPLISFIDEEGRQMGLDVGDTVTVNVLGRELTARIANLRKVEWRGMGLNFTIVMNPAALQGAPHSHIATVYAPAGEEGRITRAFAAEFPSAVGIPVREVIARTRVLLGQLTNAVRGASLATVLSGLVVLIGVVAAAQARHRYQSAVLKTLGAERSTLLRAALLRAGLLGLAAALVAAVTGAVAGWLVTEKVFEVGFRLDEWTVLLVTVAGVAATLIATALFARGTLSAAPARLLRARD